MVEIKLRTDNSKSHAYIMVTSTKEDVHPLAVAPSDTHKITYRPQVNLAVQQEIVIKTLTCARV